MSYVQIAAGLRKFDARLLAAERLTERFKGLPPKVMPGQALAAFKRAARVLGTPARLIELVDLLFSWTKPQDWGEGQTPIVWPRNETLAEAMGLETRQVQNLLRHGVEMGLIWHRDSPNGHRGGIRGEDGLIRWAYGIVLAPIGARYAEFMQLAEAAAVEARARDALRRRLTIARKSIAQIAQTALEQGYPGADWLGEVALTRMAVAHVARTRSLEALAAVVEQVEHRRAMAHAVFEAAVKVSSEAANPLEKAVVAVDIAPSRASDCAHSTTTKQNQSAKADYSKKLPERRSDGGEGSPQSRGRVEEDLERHRIDVDFVGQVCSDLTWELEYGRRSWGDLIRIAERVGSQNGIPINAWREACRVMGEKGAAAAVLATVTKHRAGEVRVPGAYLRGMSSKAIAGELQLGRTYHGLREAMFF